MVTFRLTLAQFRQVLEVVLGPSVLDELSNRVLTVCTRPRDGVTEVALEDHEATLLVEAVARQAVDNPTLQAVVQLLSAQVRPA